MAVDMVAEGVISEKTAILCVDPIVLDQLLHLIRDPIRRATCSARACRARRLA